MKYRKATFDDINQIADIRIKLLIEEGVSAKKDIKSQLTDYFEAELNNSLSVFVAEDNDEIIATCSVLYQQYPPSFSKPNGVRAYITNVYTAPECRRQGISTKLLDILVNEVKSKNISYIWLWASEQGLHLYENYGFKILTDFTTMDYVIQL